jgi:hypothetical protein
MMEKNLSSAKAPRLLFLFFISNVLMTLWWDKTILSIKITKCSIKKLEAISKKGFWVKVSRRISAGQERGTKFQTAGILRYVEELKRGPNIEIETKDFFEIASKKEKYSCPEH